MVPLRLLEPHAPKPVNVAKPYVEAWIRRLICFDEVKGRHQQLFTTKGMEQVVDKMTAAMRAKGFDTYQGGGNIFYVTYKSGQPLVVHARPLAQRVVRPRFV